MIATMQNAAPPTVNVPTEEEALAAISARDAQFDGRFYYSVLTTGIYCRPSCSSRRPRAENVRIYPTAAAAERQGFRPCKRCRPDAASVAAQKTEKIVEACRLIEAAEEMPSLTDLAAAVGVSPFHFHRLFKEALGVTPKAYAAAHLGERVRQELRQAPTVTTALYDAGFASNARFYAAAPGVLGMTPTAYRAGGAAARIRFAVGQCSLGAILVAATDRGIAAILLGDDPAVLLRDLEDRFPNAELVGGDRDFEATVAAVVGFVEAPGRGLDVPLDIRGTAFQRRVWEALMRIPAGATASYTDIAAAIGSPRAVRAVAQACAANPLAVAIPCHRVIRQDGGLSGYRWGIARKRMLLARETR